MDFYRKSRPGRGDAEYQSPMLGINLTSMSDRQEARGAV